MIGSIQSAISIGRLNVNITFINLESFRAESRQVYLDRCKRAVSYLAKLKWATIRIRTEEPDFSSMPTTPHDSDESVCDKVNELTPHDASAPSGKCVATIS